MRVALPIPADLSHTNTALGFIDSLPQFVQSPEVLLDFRQLNFARPYATLLLAHGLRKFVRDRHALGLTTRVDLRGIRIGNLTAAVSYLGHIGFFEYVGIAFGNAPGGARGSSTYLPLTVISSTELAAVAAGRALQSLVTQRCRHLASMLFADEAEQDVVEYCFREIVRNVFEHALATECTLMAQRYGRTQVEIAIADAGVGIHATLGPVYGIVDPEGSVRAALEPGITSVTGAQTGSPWDNTGFGLYVVSRLGIAAGSFAITSSGICLSQSEHIESLKRTVMQGTAIKLLVDVENAEYFSNQLKQIVDEGDRLAARDVRARRPASLSTRRREQRL